MPKLIMTKHLIHIVTKSNYYEFIIYRRSESL